VVQWLFADFTGKYLTRLSTIQVHVTAQLDEEPLLTAGGKEVCQICEVKCVKQELLGLAATTFFKDVPIGDPQRVIGWDEPIVQRFTFKTRSPLPGPISVVEVDPQATNVVEIPKAVYFEARLTKFKDNLAGTLYRMDSVMPPTKVAKQFSKSVMGLNAAPVVRFMRKLHEALPKKQPYYALTEEIICNRTSDGSALRDMPKRIAGIIREIKELFIRGIHVAEVLSGGQTLLPNDVAVLQHYATVWEMSADFLKQ
jgi:hypothetical protein